jgi:hypothetical protein
LVAESDDAFMVDAAAVAANFEMMTRLADGTGAAMPDDRIQRSAEAIETSPATGRSDGGASTTRRTDS